MYGSLCAEYYDLIKGSAPRDEVEFYLDILKGYDCVLGAMCGSGRIVFSLLMEGMNIQGVDNSPYMLDNFRKKANILGIKPVLYLESIEVMQLPEIYDAILVPTASFQLMYPENKAINALLNLRSHLKNDGLLILDLYIPWEALSTELNEFISEKKVITKNGEAINCKTHDKLNREERLILRRNIYTKILNDKVIFTEEEDYIVKWYYRVEIEEMLRKNGFKNIHIYEKYINGSNHAILTGVKKS